MGLTERHWFENEDVPENYEWDLEDAVYNSRTNKKMISKKAVDYLDWYFKADDGTADKDAQNAWYIIKNMLVEESDLKRCKYDGERNGVIA